MIIYHPASRQVVTIAPLKYAHARVLRLSWTYQYLTSDNTTHWDYKNAFLKQPKIPKTQHSDKLFTRDKRSNDVQITDPVIKQHQATCGRERSCVRFGPENCDHLECDYLLTYSITNHTFLELEISAKANGWVALGLSSDNKMGGDDVITCKKKSSLHPELQALSMAINLPYMKPEEKSNNLLKLVRQQTKDGYIYCKITKYTGEKERGSDSSLDLTNNWYQLYAKGDVDKSGIIQQHIQKPPTSLNTITMLRPLYIYSRQYKQLTSMVAGLQCITSTTLLLLTFSIACLLN